jgi:hypothetical protein
VFYPRTSLLTIVAFTYSAFKGSANFIWIGRHGVQIIANTRRSVHGKDVGCDWGRAEKCEPVWVMGVWSSIGRRIRTREQCVLSGERRRLANED